MNTPNRTAFGGRYEVIERAGAGGMAEVYRARDELLGREVAVKVLSERFSRDRAFVERFRREAQAVANLNHPNIVSLYDFGSDNSTYYIVMEYIDGRALEDIVRDDGPLLPERAAEIAGDVARALQRAHKAGLIHRDIKPSNIMMTSSGEVKVTDFGIVRALSNDGEQTMTQAGMVIGTAAYLSPEQAQGKTLDARSDVYSLGVVLYEVLTGRPPFRGDTPLSVAYKHVREDAPPPSSINPDVPQGLDAIVMKAMSKNPDNRYGSAAEMAEDLDRFRTGQKVLATPLLSTSAATVVSTPRGGTEVLPADAPPSPRAGSSRAGAYVAAALVGLGLIALLAYLLATNFFGGGGGGTPRVRVPGVVGLPVAQAKANLNDFRLEAEVEKTAADAPAGQVIAQDPDGGTRAERGSTVTLTVSRGPTLSSVPDLVGLPLPDAEAALEDEGLILGNRTEEPSEDFAEGEVSGQSLDPGEEVEEGTAVDVTVSTGSALITVPGVEGLDEATAVARIRNADLVSSVVRVPSDEVEAGIVISQSPDEGEEVSPRSTVTIEVSSGPDDPSPSPSPTEPEEGALPSLVGQDGDEVEAVLEDQGLTVDQVPAEQGACGGPPGTVCSQDPAPGTQVAEGDTVTLFVKPQGPSEED